MLVHCVCNAASLCPAIDTSASIYIIMPFLFALYLVILSYSFPLYAITLSVTFKYTAPAFPQEKQVHPN